MRVLHVVGARPNFMKASPIITRMALYPQHFEQELVHTGQHYDPNMSHIFLQELSIPSPVAHLNIGSGTHAEQTARIMLAFEPVLLEQQPDWVVVFGDVNSTLACALVCAKLSVRVAHVEAGLRSNDRTMPEEVNRILTDRMSDLLFTPSPDANENLLREGSPVSAIHFVGNVMIDSLTKILPAARSSDVLKKLGLSKRNYVLVTLHRPSNVDNQDTLREIMLALETISRQIDVVFPLHPRTREQLRGLFRPSARSRLRLIEPLGYVDFIGLLDSSRLVITDSGGVQEETTFLGISCLTVRPNTERPFTMEHGTNRLVAASRGALLCTTQAVLNGEERRKVQLELWDGRTAERIVDVFIRLATSGQEVQPTPAVPA